MVKTVIHKLMVAALMLVALWACSKVDVESRWSGEAMSFGLYVPKSVSKVDESTFVEGTTLPSGSSFGVYAFYQEGVIDSGTPAEWADGGWTPNFMYNEQVTFDGENYNYSPLRYWPANDENTISFWAYYPYSSYAEDNSKALKFYSSSARNEAYSSSCNALPVVEYTVNTDPAKQVDILFDSFGNKNKTYSNCSTPGIVNFNFRHALSLVELEITAANGSLPAGATINITALTLTSVKNHGICLAPDASIASASAAEAYWTGVDNVVNMTLESTSTSTKLVLMPQALAEDGSTGHSLVHLSMKYDIVFPAAHDPSQTLSYKDNDVDAYLWKDDTDPDPAVDNSYGVKRWLPGRRYVYRIEAGLERIEFSEVTEASWTSEWPTP